MTGHTNSTDLSVANASRRHRRRQRRCIRPQLNPDGLVPSTLRTLAAGTTDLILYLDRCRRGWGCLRDRLHQSLVFPTAHRLQPSRNADGFVTSSILWFRADLLDHLGALPTMRRRASPSTPRAAPMSRDISSLNFPRRLARFAPLRRHAVISRSQYLFRRRCICQQAQSRWIEAHLFHLSQRQRL